MAVIRKDYGFLFPVIGFPQRPQRNGGLRETTSLSSPF